MKMFYVLMVLLSFHVMASETRWIDIEWEEVPEAKEYQIELFQEEGETRLPRGKFKTDSAKWSHAVASGKYSLRIRSVDYRGVPGEWGPYLPLKVRMQNPLLLLPTPGSKTDKASVTFEWSAVNGADKYQLVVRNNEKETVFQTVTKDLKYNTYLESLGDYEWSVLTLDKEEDKKPQEDMEKAEFRTLKRVGGELDSPKVSVTITDKVHFSWSKVREAQVYEVDYFPPPKSGDKNRRFKLKLSPLVFAKAKLREGVTTLTIKSEAQGYQDSEKSIVKISRSGDKVEIEDIIQGKKEVEEITHPTTAYFKNELYVSVSLAQFKYESKNYSDDTQLKQKSLTGLGINGEWHHRPTKGSLDRKLEASFLQLSSGIDSGFASHLGYTWHKERTFSTRKFTYGGGLSYLNLPAFMGNRFDNNIKVEGTSSLGPELQLGFFNPFDQFWTLESNFALAYHPLFINSWQSGEKGLPWARLQLRVLRYYTGHQAFYGGLEYQTWTQEWSKDESSLNGVTLNIGFKSGF